MGARVADSVGRYELLIELAKGGMAELYLGRLRGLGGFAKLVAIKRILPHLAEDKLFAEMFLNEGRIAAQLAHANICQVHELGEADGDLFLAMEYLEGVTWSELVRTLPRDRSTLRLAAGVIAQACDGLHFAHELRDLEGSPTPVVHRDVSPQNLFVTTDGTCKVLDFGIAKMLKDGPRTRTGVLKGKLPYMSPEQIQGEDIDARSDVFALGVVLWESLTGKALFDRDTDFLIWKAITEAPIPPLAPFGYPASIDAVIGSALARDKDRRFRSARALGEALRNAVDEIGGAYDAGEIADVVRAQCGAKLAERQREIASAVTRRSQPRLDEPNAADTIEDKAAATVDLAPARTNAGSTVRLRSDAKAVERPTPPRRRSKLPLIIVGAVAVAGAIVAFVLARGDSPSPPEPAPVATVSPSETDSEGENESVEQQIDRAAKTAEALTGDKRIGHAMEKLEALAKWSEKTRAAAHPEEPTDSDETDRDEVPATVKPATKTKASSKAPSKASTSSAPTGPAPTGPDTASARPAATGEGFLTIDSAPFATIFLDGNRLGATPLFKMKVSAGTHDLRAELEDGRSTTKKVVVEADKTTNVGKLSW